MKATPGFEGKGFRFGKMALLRNQVIRSNLFVNFYKYMNMIFSFLASKARRTGKDK